jgi:hypothetical protein
VSLNPVVTAGLTTQVGFIRLAHSRRPNSGKPEFVWSISFANAKCIFLEKMDCRVEPGNDGCCQISMSSATSSWGAEWVIQPEEA